MKRLLFMLIALTIVSSPFVSAQQEPPTYINIFTAHTKLGHQAQYETAIKQLFAALKKVEADFPVFAAQSISSPGDYTFVTFLDSMADLDAQNEVFNKAFAQSGAALADLGKHSNGNTTLIIAPRRDLAYRPENPRVSNEEAVFAHTTILYAHPEHSQDVEAVIKAFGELNKKKGVLDGYGVSQNVTGDGPVYRIRRLAKSESDYYAQAEKNAMALGDEGRALIAKGGALLLRIETSTSVRREDLGYQP